MFIGYQKDFETGALRPVALGDTKADVEALPLMVFAEIKEMEFAAMYNNAIYTDLVELQTAKETAVRVARDNLLKSEVDPVVSNPLRWAEMSDAGKAQYEAYRRYLLDYTKTLAWWENNPLTMEEWKKEN